MGGLGRSTEAAGAVLSVSEGSVEGAGRPVSRVAEKSRVGDDTSPMHTNTVEPSPDLLTCREVGRRLSMSPRSVWRLVADGTIPSVRIGEHGHRRIPAWYVTELVEVEHGRKVAE